MHLFRFDPEVGNSITHFNSQNIRMSHLFSGANGIHIIVAYIQPDGVIGYHQAASNQLFCVIKGSGWVRDEHSERITISEGQAAYWKVGEWHESGSPTGMTVLILESEADLSENLAPL